MRDKAIYERAQFLMNRKKISGYKLSKELGFSTSFFAEWKKGKSSPKLDKVMALADYFDVPSSYFYEPDEIKAAYLLKVGMQEEAPAYYLDDDVAQIAQELHDDEAMRGMFMAARNLSKEDILRFKEIIEGYERGQSNE